MSTWAVNNFGDTRGGGLAGPVALVLVAFIALALVFLLRNLNRRLRQLPQSFDAPKTKGDDAPQLPEDRVDN